MPCRLQVWVSLSSPSASCQSSAPCQTATAASKTFQRPHNHKSSQQKQNNRDNRTTVPASTWLGRSPKSSNSSLGEVGNHLRKHLRTPRDLSTFHDFQRWHPATQPPDWSQISVRSYGRHTSIFANISLSLMTLTSAKTRETNKDSSLGV